MADISDTLEANSDQLNAVDIMSGDRIIKIREVKVVGGDQPVHVYFDGDHNRPWKPSKGMRRVLAGAWGTESAQWIGKRAKLFYEHSVTYGGKEVGGIRIRALSDIDPKGLNFSLTINRQKREPYFVPLLVVEDKPYPADKFDQAFDAMVESMRSGKMTLQGVIARCQQTGELSAEQIKRLEDAAPVDVPEDDSEPAFDPTDEPI